MTATPQPQQHPPPPYYYPAPPVVSRASRAASASLILALLAICIWPLAIASIITGIVGLNATSKPGVTGRETAWVGLGLSTLMVVGGGTWLVIATV